MLSVDLTSTLSQTTVSTLRAGWTRHRRLDNSTAEDIGGFDSATLGFPASFVSQHPAALPADPRHRLRRRVVGQGGGQDGVADDFYVQGQLTNIRGRHQLKFGVEYRTARSLVENPYRGVNLAAFKFTRNFTSLRPNVATPRPLTAATRSRRSCSATPPTQQRPAPGAAQLAELVRRRVPPGRLAALEPADRERRPALGLRGADQRARRPGQRRLRLQRRRAGVPGLSGVGAADGACAAA